MVNVLKSAPYLQEHEQDDIKNRFFRDKILNIRFCADSETYTLLVLKFVFIFALLRVIKFRAPCKD